MSITKIKISNLVVGGDLKSLQFALKNGFPIVYKDMDLPFEFDELDNNFSKRDYQEYIAFLLSMAGLNYFGDKIENITVDDKKVKVTGRRAWVYEFECENIFDFRIDPETYTGLYQVIDWINVRSIGLHSLRYLDDEDNFVKKLLFYPSQRQNKSKLFCNSDNDYEKIPKDLVTLSFLTKEELQDEGYGEIYSRLKAKDMLKQAGIKGKKVGFSSTGKPSTAPIKLEIDKREIKYFDPSPVSIDLTSSNRYVKTILKQFSKWKKKP
jgi:hypothetical protein